MLLRPYDPGPAIPNRMGNHVPPRRVYPCTETMGAIVASTSARTEARRQARARLAAKIAERRVREQEELAHITDFEAALARRDQANMQMAAAVAGLLKLGNSIADTAVLTEHSEIEIRRLHKLADRSTRTTSANSTDRTEHRQAEPPTRDKSTDTSAFGSDATGTTMAAGR